MTTEPTTTRVDSMPLPEFLMAVAAFIDEVGNGQGLYFAEPEEGEPNVQQRLRTEAMNLKETTDDQLPTI